MECQPREGCKGLLRRNWSPIIMFKTAMTGSIVKLLLLKGCMYPQSNTIRWLQEGNGLKPRIVPIIMAKNVAGLSGLAVVRLSHTPTDFSFVGKFLKG